MVEVDSPSRAPAPLFVRVSPRAAVFEVEDRLYLRLDAEGRWTTFAERGAIFRRAVDGRVLRARGRRFETLTETEARTVHAWVGRRAGELLEALRAGGDVRQIEGAADVAAARLGRAACWNRTRFEAERRRYAAAYAEPVPILPPHRYRDLVVLPATGCPNHGCAFCAFYRDRPFTVLSDDAFETHLRAVRDLFGRALRERDGCFLGSASALSLSDATLRRRLRRIRAVLGVGRRGVAAFLDPDRAPRRSPLAWARLSEEGLVEAVLGLETGLPALRARLGKDGDLARFREAVENAKAGGLALSITVLLGIGEDAAEEDAHLDATARFLASLPLDAQDRVYLSPLVDARGAHGDVAAARGLLGRRLRARLGVYEIARFAWLA